MPSWSKLSRHLFLEKKLDESGVRILRGQYDIVREYFRDKVWSRESVLSFSCLHAGIYEIKGS